VKIPEGGGQATPVMELVKGEIIQSSPQLLAGGKAGGFVCTPIFHAQERSTPSISRRKS